MKMRPVSFMVAIVLGTVLLVSGCSTSVPINNNLQNTTPTLESSGKSVSATKDANPPFQNKLEIEKTPPDQTFDPIFGSKTTYRSFSVVGPNGKVTTLSPNNRPILFEAYWCPHCQRTLVMMGKNWNKLKVKPVIVTTGFQPGTTLAQAKSIVESEQVGLGLKHINPSYYLLDTNEVKQLIKSFPELVFVGQKHEPELLLGEHTLNVWEKALS